MRVLELILKKALTVRETEHLIQGTKKVLPEKKKGKKDPYMTDLERVLSKRLMTRVQIRQHQKKSGNIEIRFSSMEDLNRLFRILMDER